MLKFEHNMLKIDHKELKKFVDLLKNTPVVDAPSKTISSEYKKEDKNSHHNDKIKN